MPRLEPVLILVSALFFGSAMADGKDPLVVATWGGAYEAVQREVLFAPFTERTGIPVETVAYNGGTAILDRDPPPDLVDMAMSESLAACAADRLQSIDDLALPPGSDGTPAKRDFIGGARHRCALTHTVYATVIAYDARAFSGQRPNRVADLFDTESFPGKRALRKTPADNMEWALLASGVPRQELYDLLSTPRGLELAFRRLGAIRDSIIWWEAGDEPVRLLKSGRAVMASGYNGRFFNARLDPESSIEIIWDGQIQEYQTWVVPAGAGRPEAARAFIRFATRTGPLTELAERLAYGPARHSAEAQVRRHPEAGIDMRPHIPTHAYNSANAIAKDIDWYSHTIDRIRERFDDWLQRSRDDAQ
ncbi:extracellular solute-binding protein [Wenzhouxiangella sediminis]|uniref:Extracellular solute-binding protein n=1 Tax=Wenzhouxiangella sediminis TaxID=1792836 RepID=A0A3E1K6N0_9GAMM|nr:extracellular solute-binding protein [Wenzhouxiangella sediminis]RFF29686.1 extracellular solute-binding protein [Wenzhouxiangella sediminis]